MMDNRVFQVNGDMKMLETVLQMAFTQTGCKTATGFLVDPKFGLILTWWKVDNADYRPFPAPLDAQESAMLVRKWLISDEAKKIAESIWTDSEIQNASWFQSIDHDGSDGDGFVAYVEDWGHVAAIHSAICAVAPCVLWYGK